MGIFRWYKLAKIIVIAENKFVDIYNFKTPVENKTIDIISLLAFATLYEESIINKLSPDDLEFMIRGLHKKSAFIPYFMPVSPLCVDFDAYKKMYLIFISNISKKIRPIISMLIAMNSMEEEIPQTEIDGMINEYEIKPLFNASI